MKLTIRSLRKRDYIKAIRFMMVGSNVDQYSDAKLFQAIYGTYFFCYEMDRSTQILAAYAGKRLVGVLMATGTGSEESRDTQEPSKSQNAQGGFGVKAVVKITDFLFGLFAKDGASPYSDANEAMLSELRKKKSVDGELNFLAADPKLYGKGIGSILLKAFEKRNRGKRYYLFTDDNCNYGFYDRMGFDRDGIEQIELELPKGTVPLTCMLYSKKF